MKKEEFLALAEQVFDQINPQGEESKISIDKNLFDEIVDQVGSEINDLGRDLIENYDLEMYSNEVTLESVTSTPHFSHTTPLCFIRLYLPQIHS